MITSAGSDFLQRFLAQVLAAGLLTHTAHAAETMPEWFEHTQENAWLANYPPTALISN